MRHYPIRISAAESRETLWIALSLLKERKHSQYLLERLGFGKTDQILSFPLNLIYYSKEIVTNCKYSDCSTF